MENINIIRLGNPLLREKSVAIRDDEFESAELKQLQQELFAVKEATKGLGLAAPQIGVRKRALVFGQKSPSDSDNIPETILFNPSFEPLSNECEEAYEGCLSVGQLRGKVLRFKHIRYSGYDVDGELIEREASDLHARVFQHEYDHLDGVIFLDRVTDIHSLGFFDELVQAGELKPRRTLR